MVVYRNIRTILFLVAGAMLLSVSVIVAQEDFNFDRAYQDYQFNLNQYRANHTSYATARSQYLQFQTLTAKTNAQVATYNMLKSRDDVVKTYLTALRMKLLETEGADTVRRESLFGRIDTEVAWFEEHRDRLPSAGTLEDYVADSDEAAERHEGIGYLFYETLANISIGKVVKLRTDQEVLISQIKAKLVEIRSEDGGSGLTSSELEKIDRWIIETENRISRSREKIQGAQTIVAELPKGKNVTGAYNEAIFRIKEAHQFLKEANTFLGEIVAEIRLN